MSSSRNCNKTQNILHIRGAKLPNACQNRHKIGFYSILRYIGDLRRHKGPYFWPKSVCILKKHSEISISLNKICRILTIFSITISKYSISVKFGFENDTPHPQGPPGGTYFFKKSCERIFLEKSMISLKFKHA